MNDIMPPGYSGQLFSHVPQAQIDESNQRKEATLSQLPLLEEVIKHFDEQIAYLGSIDSVPADLSKSAATHQKQVEANRLARNVLIQQRGFIKARIAAL